jgi:ABC-2 type transport system ATP-binding protein
MPTLAIDTDQLCRQFGGNLALNGLTLRIPEGIVFGLVGPNGAGKTTAIRLLLGLLEPTSGGAHVLGLDPATQGDAIRAKTGALLEQTGLYERLDAADNLEFYGRVWHVPRAERRARIRELLTSLGLWERRRDIVSTWSRGMKQKLAVARAMFHRPALLFLDEPTAGLDPIAATALCNDLLALVDREHVTVFLTTHNLHEAERLCHGVGVMHRGRLRAIGTPAEVRGGAASLEDAFHMLVREDQ